MKALTVWQPWASGIAWGMKPVENRTWAPPASLIGERIAIHAGKKLDLDAVDAFKANLRRTAPARLMGAPNPMTFRMMPLGAIVATARIARVVRRSDDPWFVGPIGWWLEEVVCLEPIPCKGAQGLWNVPVDVEIRILAAVTALRPDPLYPRHGNSPRRTP